MEGARAALEGAWREGASHDEIDAAGHVLDLDDGTVTCPACQHSFTVDGEGDTSCPDCGLRFA